MLRISRILIHIVVLYIIFLIGDWIQQTWNLVVPGSVIGMLIFFVLLLSNVIKIKWIEEGTKIFVNHLTLFFIPATVGVINYFELFSGKGLLIVFIVLLSTAMVMVVSGLVTQWLMGKREVPHE
ncbi:CidA/LrgA family protein [Oceanobacillus rekensis]|uniref:CidA/LrgA family protein n=1 Tax=Oceanobacillus rekensis TaxID=937927 RepID=UPI000B450CF9|nr:CidA/LrgA family protein [Oceanobacillus rekensis]